MHSPTEGRTYLLAALGFGVAACVCVAAVSMRVDADAGLARAEFTVLMDRLDHAGTKLDSLKETTANHRREMTELWQWNSDFISATNTLKGWNQEEDRYLLSLTEDIIDLKNAVHDLARDR
jgi:hypothetical protein